MPYLSILNQPQGNYRFRYPSEMNGTHGYLKAERKEGRKNKHIRVQVSHPFLSRLISTV